MNRMRISTKDKLEKWTKQNSGVEEYNNWTEKFNTELH